MRKFDPQSIIGQRFNNLTIISYSHNVGCARYFLCKCDCGTEKLFNRQNIKAGLSKSCGCFSGLDINKFLGKKYGKLEIIDYYYENKKCFVNCKCDCGNIKKGVYLGALGRGINSCGCGMITNQKHHKPNIKHGMATGGNGGRHRLYIIWQGIIARCYNKHCKGYYLYGGRGIKCEWESFNDFKYNMYESYKEHLVLFGEKDTTIERIDVNGNYNKYNCKWATISEQGKNRRNNINIIYEGEKYLLKDFCNKYNITYRGSRRLLKRGKDIYFILDYYTTKKQKSNDFKLETQRLKLSTAN